MAQEDDESTEGHDQGVARTERASERKDDKSSGKRKKIIIIVAVVAAIIAVVIGIRMWIHSRNYVSTDDAFIDAQTVRIAPQIAGRIASLPVEQNQFVRAGQLLVAISPDDLEPRVAQNQANIRNAQARLEQARSGVTTARAACRAARDQVGEPAAQLQKALDRLARLEAGYALDEATVARLDLEQARADVRNARASVASARASAEQVCSQEGGAEQDVNAAQASLAGARAQADAAQVSLDQSRITAPFAGYIANLNGNVGSYVSPGTQVMALVPRHIYVTANFKETDLHRMKAGDPVTIQVDAYPDLELKGRIASFEHAAGQEFSLLPPQNATGNYVKVVQRVAVRIEFTQKLPEGVVLGPGMSVSPSVRVH